MKFFKVLKYEFLESLTPVIVINGILLVLLCIFRFRDEMPLLSVFITLQIVAPLCIICAVIYLGIVILRLLYSRLFSSEGYLALSIPVSIDSIIIAKILTSTIWVFITFIVLFSWGTFLSFGVYDFWRLFKLVAEKGFLISILYVLFATFNLISMVFLILTILNIGKITRMKTLLGIFIFFVILFVEQFIAVFVLESISPNINFHHWTDLMMIYSSICGIFFVFIHYFLARYLIKNKLEV